MKTQMFVRFTCLFFFLLLALLALRQFDPGAETYVGMHVQNIAGQPYLILAEQETFGIYTPAGKNIDNWVPVYEDRSGTVLGDFRVGNFVMPNNGSNSNAAQVPATNATSSADIVTSIQAPQYGPPTPAPERRVEGLGIFFKASGAIFDVLKPDKNNDVVSFPSTLSWEAAAPLNGQMYAFGAKLDPPSEDGRIQDGILKAARFDGKMWSELPAVSGPIVQQGVAGFWLKAVALDKRIALLWRGAKLDQTIGFRVEGLRISTDGDMGMCFFDGTKFGSETKTITGLPKGNTCIWVENGSIKCLVQTRGKSADRPRGCMEIWNISPDGKAERAETIGSEHNTLGLFPLMAAEHFQWDNREYILRSNWQRFELWRRADSGTWELQPEGAAGLPTFALERKLYGALAFCAGVVLLGAWLAFARRKHALTLLQKLQPAELYAPLAARSGAYLVDMLLVLLATRFVSRLFFDSYLDGLPTPLDSVTLPSPPFMICSMLYFTLCEWLLSATLGKFLMGLRVVSDGGLRVSLWSAFMRSSAGLIERQPLMLIVSAPMVFFSPRRQRLGDLLSRTFVVQKQGLDHFFAQRAASEVRGEPVDALPGEPLPEKKKESK